MSSTYSGHLQRHDRVTPPEGERKDILSMQVSQNDTTGSYYRILFGDKVKYLEIVPGIFGAETLMYPPDLFASLPTLPYGEWTVARISAHDRVEVFNRQLPGVTYLWHPARFDILSLRTVRKLGARAWEVMHPSLGGTMIVKYARFAWEVHAANIETRIFQEIEGKEIGPEFLGHVHEHGRFIGFLLRKVEGHAPTWESQRACADVVRKLHERGIVHGGLRLEEFIITEEGEAVLLDFEHASWTADIAALIRERDLVNRLFS